MANRDPMTDDEKFALFGTATGAGAGGIRGRLVVIDIAGRSVLANIDIGGIPRDLAITPDGKFALLGTWAVFRARCHLVVIDIIGCRALPNSFPVGLSPISIVISAEGSSVLARAGPVGKADNPLDNLDKNRFATWPDIFGNMPNPRAHAVVMSHLASLS